MTREKRTKLIRHLRYNRSIGADYLITDEDADEIIKALEQEPCDDAVSRQAAIDTMDKVLIVFRDLGLSCAYDMPSFWYHDKKDYKVIPTKYHKGYMQALKDAEAKIKAIMEELCYG